LKYTTKTQRKQKTHINNNDFYEKNLKHMQINIEKNKTKKKQKHINSNEFYAKRLKPMQIHNKNTKKTTKTHK
jgi:hypothetical protein